MPYKIYTDKDEEFVCEVSVKNASLKDSIARIILETAGLNLVYRGYIRNGKCVVPIKKVKGLLAENTTGKIQLELVVDGMYFKPWESTFQVEENTTVKVRVDEAVEEGQPSVKVTNPLKEAKLKNVASEDILRICEQFNINRDTLSNRRSDFKKIVAEYFKATPEFISKKHEILQEISRFFK